jgi:hypothetical protein
MEDPHRVLTPLREASEPKWDFQTDSHTLWHPFQLLWKTDNMSNRNRAQCKNANKRIKQTKKGEGLSSPTCHLLPDRKDIWSRQ